MRDSLLWLAAGLALLPSAALADDCPMTMTPELESSLGDVAATLKPGSTVYQPADLSMVGSPVSYIIATRQNQSDEGLIVRLDYRLGGVVRKFGDRYSPELRKAFDNGFTSSQCGSSKDTPCVVAYEANASTGRLTGAELSAGELSIPQDASGPALPLVKADYDLDDSDPVFLVCRYEGAK